ncbi:MAG TPA: hypothetical protein DHV62_03145 [Elusimicrobia bacterium]|jgi:hypothetical protein|nr:hypothetical protein [Elusimicrobiota bacterium]
MKRKVFTILLLLTLSIMVFSCAKKKEEKTSEDLPTPTEMPAPSETLAPQVSTSPEMDKLYIDYMVEQAKLSQEYVHKTSPTDRADYEKKSLAIREKYRLDQHPDFRQYYANLPPNRQMEFMQKMNQAMDNAGLRR